MEGRKQREDGGKLTNKFSDTSNFNRSPLCLNALQIRCARVSQGTRTFAFRVFIHDDDDDDDDGPREVVTFFQRHSPVSAPFSSSPRRVVSCRVLLIYFSPHDGPHSTRQTFPRQNNFSRIRLARSKSRLFPLPLPLRRPYTRQKTRQDGRVSRQMEIPLRGFRGCACACTCVCVCAGEIRECTLRDGCTRGEDGRVDASVYLAFCLASEGRKELLLVL